MGYGWFLPASFPLGLTGMMVGKDDPMKAHKFDDGCGGIPSVCITDHEDKVSWIIKTLHADELQLLYHYLYNLGYRDSHSGAATARLKDRYVTKGKKP